MVTANWNLSMLQTHLGKKTPLVRKSTSKTLRYGKQVKVENPLGNPHLALVDLDGILNAQLWLVIFLKPSIFTVEVLIYCFLIIPMNVLRQKPHICRSGAKNLSTLAICILKAPK
eukprot:NODE_503_length_6696_cov_1.475216.p4 type:complete len:115 gc:universal NODE_503_length_6696_cov_1.475216:5088-5432(+)